MPVHDTTEPRRFLNTDHLVAYIEYLENIELSARNLLCVLDDLNHREKPLASIVGRGGPVVTGILKGSVRELAEALGETAFGEC